MISWSRLPQAAVLVALAASSVFAQPQWCGKNYMASQPIVPPGGQFAIPSTSSSPLLAFRCSPAIKPYLAEDVSSALIIVDTVLTHSHVAGAAPISLGTRTAHGKEDPGKLQVTINIDGKRVTTGHTVALNATKVEIPISLSGLRPRMEAFDVSCSATFTPSEHKTKPQTFKTSTQLSFLPTPPKGRSVTKMDLRTGALLAKPVGKGGVKRDAKYETVFPIGYYTDFGGYLATNLSVLDDIKRDRFTIVHPIPTFDNLTALDLVVDRMEELGLFLMYDMRWTYLNTTAVTEEVNRIKNRPNLLLWYTADEPDGWVDPQNGTSIAYDTIYSLDGYHPVSLVLNCENYFFDAYTKGTDIVLQDTYMIGNNVTFSSQWGTPCTTDYGDCGCDNCKGSFEDISTRMDEFAQRLFDLGWDRSKAVWTVPQAFGEDTYWKRKPTGREWTVQAALAINHGALGVVPWSAPTTPDIRASSSALAKALTASMKDFILDPAATFHRVVEDRVDAGVWTVGRRKLVLVTNLNYEVREVRFESLGVAVGAGGMRRVFDGGAEVRGAAVRLESVGTGAFIVD
ncbi:hypothetical protein BXZ70DRAFT_461711 [Cristinia sonorae]|uniref:Glycoside hydrolase subgroup catalytic core protein n=1 Tax=Cristinia sonorae TaxID=1940300 RepID=A0A8K0UIJ0_9AGAR|nr:hypothetical protein BXZ70DRAFT_461711 [Cristinia sonorae]